ncbi:hypothetical protein [Treponema endosymbiont of Eucomonympha sp.]|nr:hypothetical protein [Treponema endosymbiont of Eucomonympha sp.]
MAEKSLYYIKIRRLAAGFLARLTGSYAPLTKFFARLAGPCE